MSSSAETRLPGSVSTIASIAPSRPSSGMRRISLTSRLVRAQDTLRRSSISKCDLHRRFPTGSARRGILPRSADPEYRLRRRRLPLPPAGPVRASSVEQTDPSLDDAARTKSADWKRFSDKAAPALQVQRSEPPCSRVSSYAARLRGSGPSVFSEQRWRALAKPQIGID